MEEVHCVGKKPQATHSFLLQSPLEFSHSLLLKLLLTQYPEHKDKQGFHDGPNSPVLVANLLFLMTSFSLRICMSWVAIRFSCTHCLISLSTSRFSRFASCCCRRASSCSVRIFLRLFSLSLLETWSCSIRCRISST